MNQKIKIILAGTGTFSAKIFKSLLDNDRFEVVGLISQPNRALDRSKNVILTPVAKLAKEYQVTLFQPNKIKEIVDELKEREFDFFITAAYGQIIPNDILALPKKAAINVHGSILEKYRGAAPVQHAILNDEKETGISLIYMIDKMDAGDIIAIEKVQIEEDDTALEIYDKLAKVAIENLPLWLDKLYKNEIIATKQDESKVTFASKIKNEDAELHLEMSTKEALNKIRAFNDQPGAFIVKNQKRLKIFQATNQKNKSPLVLEFADGKLYLIEYQFEGKKRIKHTF
ncbi:methionyl-tRNA formyltransferase [Metamycoplasma arthritidis]|uniref:Methionyl-tRNA formyltransferase n=1 Tax=Metamycoplasma arthritidis (strain 158L3-1) TaxID=243272 RepID=B3PNE5_META1|nr:methionyl-tRNA formyltransferase [Metamycoplasma arthritidis]ACF07547.1 methionyl-tRNA formyltransferase [Metamycoplasma arthritidis 158L3-1]VEU79055.1 methionyl-tRNA formyltransferase [Metamycoplasma arthritidis]